MQIAQNFATKLYVAFVVIAMMLMAVAPAQAKTAEELQAEITALMATINELQSQVGQGGTSVASGICPYSWTRSLSSGSTGDDVKKLQMFLNASEDTRVAMAGAGSVGSETMYYGPATAAAVSKFQVKYRADILSPGGLVNPTGYFGPASIAKANSLCSGASTGGDDSTDDTDGDDADEDDSDTTLQGEASLDNFEIDDADDTDVSEGDEEAELGVITVEFTDGDAEITRLDIALQDSEGTDSDAWDTFDTVALFVDGESVAEVDASSKDDYLGDEDDGVLRFADLSLVAMEDEEVEITVVATLQDNLDAENLGEWDMNGESLRFFDADDVATTENGASTGEVIDTDEVATFNIETAGENEELKFALGDGNPDSTDIVVDETSSTNGVTVLEYTIKAEDNDIDLNELSLVLTTSDSNIGDVVSDVEIDIDGEVFSDDTNTALTSTSSALYTFDIDGDVTVAEDEEVTVKVMVDFKRQDTNYANGATIQAKVTSAEAKATDAEGADDLAASQFSGTAIGDVHHLVADGILIPVDSVEVSADTTGDNDQTGEFTIEFEVTAVEGDFYITDNVAASTSATDGVAYMVEVGSGTTTNSGVLSSTADEEVDGVFTVRDGETETFTLTVTVDTSASTQARVTLSEVNYSEDPDGLSGTPYYPTPASDFRTAYKNINAN